MVLPCPGTRSPLGTKKAELCRQKKEDHKNIIPDMGSQELIFFCFPKLNFYKGGLTYGF